MIGAAPNKAFDIGLGASVGVGVGVSVSLKHRRREHVQVFEAASIRVLDFRLWELESRSFGGEMGKQEDRERDCLHFNISSPRRLDWFDGAAA